MTFGQETLQNIFGKKSKNKKKEYIGDGMNTAYNDDMTGWLSLSTRGARGWADEGL